MRQENSVLFALRDLRSLESDRIAEEQRLERQRRAEEEQRRLAEEQLRRAEEARQSEAAFQRRRDQEEREALAHALREESGRSEQLEADVRHLRELLSAARPAARPRRLWPIVLVAGVVATVGVVLALERPSVPERVVYVRSPPPRETPSPAPATPPAPEVASPITRAEHPSTAPLLKHKRPKAVNRPVVKPTAGVEDCDGKDPLCGTML